MGTNKTTMNEFKRYVEEGFDSSNTLLKTLSDIERKYSKNIHGAVSSMKDAVESFPSHSFEGASLKDLENLGEKLGVNPVRAGLIYSFVAIKAAQETNRTGDNDPKWARSKLFRLVKSNYANVHVQNFLVQLMITSYETAYGDVSDASVMEESAYAANFVARSCLKKKDFAKATEYSDKSFKLFGQVTSDAQGPKYDQIKSLIYKTAGKLRLRSGKKVEAGNLLLEALAAAENTSTGREKDERITSIKRLIKESNTI